MGTNLKPHAASLVEQILVFKSCCRVDEEMSAATGLNPKEALVLIRLGGRDGTSSEDLARAAALSASRMSRLIDGLHRRGLVERQVDPANRRKVILTLTTDGRHALRTLRVAAAKCERMLKARIAPANRATAARGVALLVSAFQD